MNQQKNKANRNHGNHVQANYVYSEYLYSPNVQCPISTIRIGLNFILQCFAMLISAHCSLSEIKDFYGGISAFSKVKEI